LSILQEVTEVEEEAMVVTEEVATEEEAMVEEAMEVEDTIPREVKE